MKTVLVFFFLIFSFVGKSQNLVVNGDFELYDQCPTVVGSVNGYLQSGYCPFWEGTTDYYNSCDIQPNPCSDYGHVGIPLNSTGYQSAQHGEGYIGLFIYYGSEENYREYIVLPLMLQLTKDSVYNISFFVSKAETFGMVSDGIMVSFTEDSVPILPGFDVLPLNGFKMSDSPVIDYTNWVQLKKQYKAVGNEKFMVIGNFKPNSETSFEQGDFFPWMCNGNIIGYENEAYYYIDNVSVELNSERDFFPNVFSPNGDGINDRFVNLIYGYTIIQVEVFNRWGNRVYVSHDTEVSWDGTFHDQLCNDGIYFYSGLIQNNTTGEIITKQGAVSLLR